MCYAFPMYQPHGFIVSALNHRLWIGWLGAFLLIMGCDPETAGIGKAPGHADLYAEASSCVSYYLDQCDDTQVLDFGEIPPGELASVWVRLDNTGEVPLNFVSWDAADLPTELKVTHAFNPDGGLNGMTVLPNRLNVGDRLWVSVRLLPGLSPGPLPKEKIIFQFEHGINDTLEIEFEIEGEILGCEHGWADCDADMTNGCEQDILTANIHCGACNNSCVIETGSGTCINGICDFICDDFYSGELCDQDVNECANGSHTCDENATCQNQTPGYTCVCNENYEGNGFVCDPSPAKTDTVSDTIVLQAGASINVTCNVFDAWNNPLPADDESWLEVPDGFELNTVDVGVFSVSHTVAGVYALKCHIRDIVDDTPLAIQVVPGDPYDWSLTFDDSDCQKPGQILNYSVTVTDYWANPIDDPALSVVASPIDAIVETGGGQHEFTQDGNITITFSVAEPHHAGANAFNASFDVIVDTTPPEIEITNPSRASMMTAGGYTPGVISIDFEVIDLLTPVSAISLNEDPVTVASGQLAHSSTVVETSVWGVNILRMSATDACDNTRQTVQSYLRSPAYYTPAVSSNSQAQVSNGIIAQFNQPIFDDGNRADIDDLATLAETVMDQTDIDAFISNPLAHSDGFDSNGDGNPDQQTIHTCGFGCSSLTPGFCSTETVYEEGWWVSKTGNLTYGDPTIHFVNATSQGLEIKMSVSNLSMPLNVFASYEWSECGRYITDAAGIASIQKVEVYGIMPVAMNGSLLSTEFETLNITLTNTDIDVNWGSWTWWDFLLDSTVGALGNLILDYFTEDIEEELEVAMRNNLEPLMAGFFQDFTMGTSMDLGAPLNGTLTLSSEIGYANFGAGYGRMGLKTQIAPDQKGPTIPQLDTGSIKSSGITSWFDVGASAFGVAMKKDFLNQIMWATWYGGAMSLPELESSLDLGDGVAMDLEALSPPVIMPSDNSDEDGLLGFGDLWASGALTMGDLGTIPITFYLSALVGFDMSFNGDTNEISLVPTDNITIYIEVVSLDEPAYQGEMSVALADIFETMIPELLTPILSSIPLPEFDVGSLAGLNQPLVWRLSDGIVEQTDNQLRLEGNLQ